MAPADAKTKAQVKLESDKPLSKIIEVQEEIHPKSIPTLVHFIKFEDIIDSRKFQKVPFFTELNEQEERANKKKYTENKIPELPTVSNRNSEIKIGETPEEMVARISRELEEEAAGPMGQDEGQNCTKCGIFPVEEQFRIDRELGYCQFCADMLRLGQSKEARNFEAANRLGTDTSSDDAAV